MYRSVVVLWVFLLASRFLAAQAQQAVITGRVTTPDGGPAIGITVALKGTANGAITDVNGKYRIEKLPPGTYTLSISGIGFRTVAKTVTVAAGDPVVVNHTLEEETKLLDELAVIGKSEATVAREQAYAVEVVEAKGFKNLATNANDILNKISGVNIRQSGGVGSDFTLSLNGLTGGQVRVFLDGVPMDYFGSSLTLNNFSANLIERIEVYKGVVPIHLSSDALGGAINVITGQQTESYLDASYSIGSFGTHVASLNGQYRDEKSGFAVRAKSFLVSAQNNYEVPVRLVDFGTGKADDFDTWVERFHDAYQSRMAWVEAGFIGIKWADQLMVGVMYSDNEKEIQQRFDVNGQAKIPFGGVVFAEDKIITNLAYNKSGMLNGKLSANAYFVGVFADNIYTDTSSYVYDWFGGRERRNGNGGEFGGVRKTWLTITTDNYLANVNAEYALGQNHSLAANYSHNRLEMQGADPFNDGNNTQFGNPSTLKKAVFAANYTQAFFGQKLKNTFFAKRYQYRIASLETNFQGTDTIPFSESRNNTGIGLSTTYQFNKLQLKASYENAVRFPEIVELFGNGLNLVPNPTLQPEQSHNYNFGAIFNSRGKHPVVLSANGFLRDAENFIVLKPSVNTSQYINNLNVVARGVDLAGSYRYDGFLLALNGTYLDLRDNTPWVDGVVGGTRNTAYEERLPNMPYWFGNATLSYRKQALFRGGDNFSASVIQNYVHQFFFQTENLGSKDKGVIPTQWTTNLELVYSLAEERYNFSFGVTNLWDAQVFDNFQQLRPGRAFNMKLRYFIH